MDFGALALTFGDDFVQLLIAVAPKLFALFKTLGGRDAFMVALDAALETARAAHDQELRKKHDE
jgi:hypothetical protein